MNTETRKRIEYYFLNYEKILEQDLERQSDIVYEGIVSDESKSPGGSGRKGSAIENKALRLVDMFLRGSWVKVVEYTFTAFRFEYEFEIMKDLYLKKKNRHQIYVERGVGTSSLYLMKNRWLETAYNWAKEFKLIS